MVKCRFDHTLLILTYQRAYFGILVMIFRVEVLIIILNLILSNNIIRYIIVKKIGPKL